MTRSQLSWDGVLAWRMRRQLLEPVGTRGVVETVRALCGVQAQVASSAELAIALRRRKSEAGDVGQALSDRLLMRTWAMRGTLHLLDSAQASAYLALVGALRTWERPAWQRTFGVTAAEIEVLAEAVSEVLEGRVLERDELIEEVAAKTGNRDLDEHLRSGWGAVLKPMAWMGLLCNGPSRGNRVTFTSPGSWLEDWPGVPDPETAARVAIPAYLRVYGPATINSFDAWLTRGSSRKADLRAWFALLEDELVTVEVEGEECYALTADLEELKAAAPSRAVRLLAGFDQYLLGPGTADPRIVPPHRRKQVSKTAGWISPVVLVGGRVAGVWGLDGDLVLITLFEESPTPPGEMLEAEVRRVAAFLARDLGVSVMTG